METHFTGVPTSHLSLGSKDVLGIIKLFTLWNAEKPRWFIERSMMQSWESYNKIQWSPHNLFVDMCVARAPWHVLVDGWDWWGRGGAEDGEVDRGE